MLSKMKRFFSVLVLVPSILLVLTQCAQQRMQRQALESRTVVLDIGHYYAPGKGGQGARTPDASQGGMLEECEFWYRYAGEVKKVVEDAGYRCVVCNRADEPSDPALARLARNIGVVHVKSPDPTAVYLSRHHPNRMAVGILSADFALDCKPGAVVFLHLNSDSDTWRISDKGAFYCNQAGVKLATTMAEVMNRRIFDHGMPNHGVPCGVVIRTNGHLGGGDWLNTCNESYVPAVITEVAFVSNPEHARFLNRDSNARKFARAIGEGIVSFMRSR